MRKGTRRVQVNEVLHLGTDCTGAWCCGDLAGYMARAAGSWESSVNKVPEVARYRVGTSESW